MRKFEFISEEQMFQDAIEKVGELKLPKRATKYSAGYDIFSPYSFSLKPNEEIKIPTFVRAIMNPNDVLFIVPRSGLGFKYYTRLANTIGVIDADYAMSDNEGHIWIKIRNESTDKIMTIKAGEAVCQGIFMNYLMVDGDSTNFGNERNGGFGSTTVGGI